MSDDQVGVSVEASEEKVFVDAGELARLVAVVVGKGPVWSRTRMLMGLNGGLDNRPKLGREATEFFETMLELVEFFQGSEEASRLRVLIAAHLVELYTTASHPAMLGATPEQLGA